MSYEPVLAALAEPTRRRLFEDVVRRPRPVGELADRARVSQPAVSQHLKTLREAGLVQVEVAGTRRIYHASPAGLKALRTYVERLWDRALTDFEHCVVHFKGSEKDQPAEQRTGERHATTGSTPNPKMHQPHSRCGTGMRRP